MITRAVQKNQNNKGGILQIRQFIQVKALKILISFSTFPWASWRNSHFG